MKFTVHARPNFVRRDTEIVILAEGPGYEAIVTKLEFYKLELGQIPPFEGGWIIDNGVGKQADFLQAMLDGAWEAGLRPTGYSNVSEAMRASDKHLQDMRAIAFHKLGVPKP